MSILLFVTPRLWSIFGDSGSVVSSVVSSAPALLSFHMLTGNLDRAHVAYRLRADVHPCDPAYSVLDLKADCRGYKYVEETIKMLPEKPEPVLLEQIRSKVACLGRIHAAQPSFSLS